MRIKGLLRRVVRALLPPSRRTVGPPTDWRERDRQHIESWRRLGVTIGERCRIYAKELPTEPWLIVIGNDVGIAGGVKFLTHDGIAVHFRRERPMAQKFGTIIIGDYTFIGENALLLPGTRIGQGVIVGAGSVVRGTIPDNSVVVGNPARVVGRASLLLERAKTHPNVLDTFGLPEAQRRAIVRAHFGLDSVASQD